MQGLVGDIQDRMHVVPSKVQIKHRLVAYEKRLVAYEK
jgi:hypothetical protein